MLKQFVCMHKWKGEPPPVPSVSAGAAVRRGPAGAFAATGGLAVLEFNSGFCGFDVAVVAAAELHAAV